MSDIPPFWCREDLRGCVEGRAPEVEVSVLRPGFEPGSAAFLHSYGVERPLYMVLYTFNLAILPEHLKIGFLLKLNIFLHALDCENIPR